MRKWLRANFLGMLAVVGSLGLAGRGQAEAQPAYEAEVIGLAAFAFSGPGIGYYPAMALEPGQKVTVFGERTEEWVSILPPKGSFSWVPARVVEEQPDGTGAITASDCKVRIGSVLTDAHHVFQVTLS